MSNVRPHEAQRPSRTALMDHLPGAQRQINAGSLASVLLACLVLVGMMLCYWYYPFPSGKRPDVVGFVVVWLKEIVAVALGLVALVAIAFTSVARRLRERKRRNNAG